MREVSIIRNRGPFAILRSLKLYVDNKLVGRIKNGQTIQIEIPDDAVYLVGKVDWGKTDKFSLANVTDGDFIEINSYSTLNPFRNLGIIPMPVTFSKQV